MHSLSRVVLGRAGRESVLWVAAGPVRNLCEEVRAPEPSQGHDVDGRMKINKLMVRRGICSRREANDFIKRGLVLVDGLPATLGQMVQAKQAVQILPAAQQEQARKVSIMLHKPEGFVSQDSDCRHQQRLAIR